MGPDQSFASRHNVQPTESHQSGLERFPKGGKEKEYLGAEEDLLVLVSGEQLFGACEPGYGDRQARSLPSRNSQQMTTAKGGPGKVQRTESQRSQAFCGGRAPGGLPEEVYLSRVESVVLRGSFSQVVMEAGRGQVGEALQESGWGLAPPVPSHAPE